MNTINSVKDIMTTDVITIHEDAFAHDMVSTLTKYKITGAPVVNTLEKIVGVVSLSDAALNTHQEAAIISKNNADYEYYSEVWNEFMEEEQECFLDIKSDIKVKDIMTAVVLQVHPDATVAEASSLMLSSRVHRLIVMKDEKFVGIVTTTDILRAVAGK